MIQFSLFWREFQISKLKLEIKTAQTYLLNSILFFFSGKFFILFVFLIHYSKVFTGVQLSLLCLLENLCIFALMFEHLVIKFQVQDHFHFEGNTLLFLASDVTNHKSDANLLSVYLWQTAFLSLKAFRLLALVS